MLNRIININSEIELRSKPRAGSVRGIKSGYYGSQYSANDKILFSPAVNYLSRLGWRLRELRYSGKDKIKIAFIIDDIDFEAEIDFLTCNMVNRQNYIVSRQMNLKDVPAEINILLSVLKTNSAPDNEIEKVELEMIKRLFERAAFLDIKKEITRSDSRALKDLMDEINVHIVKEFEYINTAFLTLVDKLLPGNIQHSRKFADGEEPVIIEKIKVASGNG